MAEQFRQIALRVCDRLDAAEATTVTTGSLPAIVGGLGEDELQYLLKSAAALRSETDAVIAASAGAVAKLSDRELGYAGLAARKGHRSPVAMIQSITGSSRSEASRQVRLGEAMGEAAAAVRFVEADPTGRDAESAPVAVPWFEPVTRAVSSPQTAPQQ